MERVVARIGRPQGLRGEVSAEVRTDAPDRRFVPGAVFSTDPAERGPLTLVSGRDHSGVLVLAFEGVHDREGAELLRGVRLLVDVTASDEPDAWYEHELVGLPVTSPDGEPLGEVLRLQAGGAQDLLVVRSTAGRSVLVPFVSALVPVVDVAGRRVVVDPPGGLFDDDTHDPDDTDDPNAAGAP